MKKSFRVTLAALAAFTVHAMAQSSVCIGGDLSRLTAAEKSHCLASAARVRAEADRLHAPAGWHFFIVCSEYDWQTYAAYTDRPLSELAAAVADTNLTRRTTFFRGQSLPLEEPAALKLAVAREIVRATLGTNDELAIQKRLDSLLPATNPAAGTLRASR